MSRKRWSFTLVMLIVGFMVAVQYETLQQPQVVDTRDEWQLKESLKIEQQLQIDLLKELQKYEEQLKAYEEKRAEGKETALQQTVEELREKAGLTDVVGAGITLKLTPLTGNVPVGEPVPVVSPQLLQRLVNELDTYGAMAIQIADERIIATTPIRDLNGKVAINGSVLPPLPIEIRVIAKDAQKLYDRMKVSNAFDYFAIDNIELTMSKPGTGITVSGYDGELQLNSIKAIQTGKEN